MSKQFDIIRQTQSPFFGYIYLMFRLLAHIHLGRDHYFSLGGIVISRRQEMFFYRRLSACNFSLSTHCADNFFKLPKFPITGVASADNFFRCTSGADNLFQQFFSCRQFFYPIAIPPPGSCRQFFPNRDTPPPGKNNGPSLIDFLFLIR